MTDDEKVDPAEPLAAQIEAVAEHMAFHRLPLDDVDPIVCACRGVSCRLTVGDLRRAVEALREQVDVIDRLRQEVRDTFAAAKAHGAEAGRFADEARGLRAELAASRDETDAARDETDLACAVFSKHQWSGRLGLPFEFHVQRGRRMAGLAERAAGAPAGGGGAVDAATISRFREKS